MHTPHIVVLLICCLPLSKILPVVPHGCAVVREDFVSFWS